MSPQEKAKELVEKFKPFMYCYMGSGMLTNDYDEGIAYKYAKECATIAVDEIIYGNFGDGYDHQFWHDVRTHITNL